MFWLSASPAPANDNGWVFDVAHAHIADNYAWPRPDYTLRICHQKADFIVVCAYHKDDAETGKLNSEGVIRAGGGKSFDIYLDAKTHVVLREVGFQ